MGHHVKNQNNSLQCLYHNCVCASVPIGIKGTVYQEPPLGHVPAHSAEIASDQAASPSDCITHVYVLVPFNVSQAFIE